MMDNSTEQTTQSSRLGKCEICNLSDAKYICPCCECKTCSLPCNKIHKSDLECTGERDKTKYVSLKSKDKNTNLVMLSDYRLLEDITRRTENFHKAGKLKNLRMRHISIQLQLAAAARNIKFKFYPPMFKRNMENSSVFDKKQNLIYWHIDWYFVNAENLKLSDSKVSEVHRLSSVLGKYLSPQNEVLRKQLMFYEAAGHSGVQVLMKDENSSGAKYYQVDPRDTLRECLKNKTVLEYPIFYVVLSDHKYGFNIIDSDCEDDEMTGEGFINAIIKNDENSSQGYYENLKNLLGGESSGDEISPSRRNIDLSANI